MDTLLDEHMKACSKGDLSKSIINLQKTIDELERARSTISSFPASSSITLAKVQNPVRTSFDDVNRGLKDVYNALGKYSKALDKRFRDKPLPTAEYDALSTKSNLISRAIGMHFLREGLFTVASCFLRESSRDMTRQSETIYPTNEGQLVDDAITPPAGLGSMDLRGAFSEMYYILDQMKSRQNLEPAIAWARNHSSDLEARGSNLEFELGRLQFAWLFEDMLGEDQQAGIARRYGALDYARRYFVHFQSRHLREIQQLIGALAFCPNLQESPYKLFFHSRLVWEDIASSFTREFCSLLGLSADSPVYIATTAGAIALPTLQKLQIIMETKRTEWTTQNELPVEIPLPPAYRFHSIFVCPVSKEQATDENPPMMMPCGHVIALESLQRLGKVSKFKCPYCPGESRLQDATKIFL